MTVYRPDNELGLEVLRDGEIDMLATKAMKNDPGMAQKAFEIYIRGLQWKAPYSVCVCGGSPTVTVTEPVPTGKQRAVAKCTNCGHRWLTEHA